jgi:Protein of Unknown function (DUF2784)
MHYLYIIVVAAVVAAHFAFIGYLVVGGFLAVRWPRTIWLHIATVIWGFGSIGLHLQCPLTSLERWGREHAGMAPLPSDGFIAHYITGVLYPASMVGVVEAVVFTLVVVSWGLFARAAVRGRRGQHRELVSDGRGAR